MMKMVIEMETMEDVILARNQLDATKITDIEDGVAVELVLSPKIFQEEMNSELAEAFCLTMNSLGSSLSLLAEMKIASDPDNDNEAFVPVSALGIALKKARCLTSLTIENCTMMGEIWQYDQFATSFEAHDELFEVDFDRCKCLVREQDPETLKWSTDYLRKDGLCLLDSTLSALGNLSSLAILSFEGCIIPGELQKETIRRVCTLPEIFLLKLASFRLKPSVLKELCEVLRGNERLWGLSLSSSSFDQTNGGPLKELFQTTPSLEDFSIFAKNATSNNVKDILEAMGESNQMTAILSAPKMAISSNEVLACARAAFRNNYSMESLTLYGYQDKGAAKSYDMTAICDHELNFLTKANMMGRGALLTGTLIPCVEKKMWVDLFEAAAKEAEIAKNESKNTGRGTKRKRAPQKEQEAIHLSNIYNLIAQKPEHLCRWILEN